MIFVDITKLSGLVLNSTPFLCVCAYLGTFDPLFGVALFPLSFEAWNAELISLAAAGRERL